MGPRTFDEALGVPSDKSLRLALRTQQVVALETGVCNTVDPLAGSYYVESLTHTVQKAIEAYLDKIGPYGRGVYSADIDAHEDQTGYAGTWQLTVYAICAA